MKHVATNLQELTSGWHQVVSAAAASMWAHLKEGQITASSHSEIKGT